MEAAAAKNRVPPSGSVIPGRRDRAASAAACAYASLVLLIWGAHNPLSGMGAETAFPYMSETVSAFRGFFYGDPLRPYTSVFYHLSYLAGAVVGARGSYVPYQVVYALLWWARGLLVFAIARRLLPRSELLCFAAGALALVHASDDALQWVGQMNQFGFIFWMLLAMYCLTRACEPRADRPAALAAAACVCEHLCLWSYESPLFLVLLFPLFVAAAGRNWRKARPMLAWYSVAALYVFLSIAKFALSGGRSYQESVMRKAWTPAAILSDWALDVTWSLKFWKWTAAYDWRYPPGRAFVLSAAAAAIYLATCVYIGVIRRPAGTRLATIGAKSSFLITAAGVVLAVFSFPAYILLELARSAWRTQMLSGPGSGMALAGLVGLAACGVRPRALRTPVAILGSAVIIYCGSLAAIQKGGVFRSGWERQRTAIAEVLKLAPAVRPDTVVALTNIRRDADPFGDNLWFDLAVRLAYPGVRIAGLYFYVDGSLAPGGNLALDGALWRWNGSGFEPAVAHAAIENTVVVRYDASGNGRLETALPSAVCRRDCACDPARNILPGPPSPIAVRRYRLAAPLEIRP